MWTTLALALFTAAEIPPQLSLDQAIAMALRSSPAVHRAAARVRESEAQQRQTRSEMLPQVGLTVSDMGQTFNLRALGISTTLLPAKAGPFQTVDARVAASEEVWNASRRDRARAAKEAANASGHLASNTREVLVFEISVAFADALRAQAAVATSLQQVELARRLHTVSLDRLQQGIASKLDTTRSAIQLQNEEQALLEARNELIAARLQLANLIHAEPSSTYKLLATNYSPANPVTTVRADYRAAESALRVAELRLQAARHERYPTATIHADYGQNGSAWNSNSNTFLVQGSLHIPIYTGGRIEADIAEANAEVAEAKADLEEIRARVETETLVARSALESAQKQLDIARRTGDLAREEVDLSLERFKAGVADNTEVINAQERLARAEAHVVLASFQIDIAQAKLRRARGVN